MKQFISRAYNSFEIDKRTNALVIKRSKEFRLRDEADYYINIPKNLAVYFPRLNYYRLNNDIHEISMEYYAYDNLGNLMINNHFDENLWVKISEFIFTYINNCFEHRIDTTNTNDSRLMYINKTENEYNNLINNFEFFKIFETNDSIVLNGVELKTFKTIWPKIKEYIENNCLVNNLNYIHGDFCFSNILYGINPINNDVVLKYIDPRGCFGNTKFYGDYYYDLAKLLHSCDGGYEYFITDNFKISNDNINFTLEYSNNNNVKIRKIFNEIILKYNFNQTKTNILQGTIFIGMCARHYDSLDRQKAMFLTGLKILNKIYKSLL